MELDNNNQCGDEDKFVPVDEDCDKWCIDECCVICKMIVECYENNNIDGGFNA